MNKLFIYAVLFITNTILPLKLDRVILSTDNNPNYIQFWPIVAKAWKEIVGITPTLALIGDADVVIDENLGDIIRFKPIEDVPTSLQAQTIRLLLPILFPNDMCILSDIDMIPLSKDFFVNPITNIPDNAFVVYCNSDYHVNSNRWPMCYCAARGSTFIDIFQITTLTQLRETLQLWSTLNLKWDTDERMLFKYVTQWRNYKTHCFLLNHKSLPHRIDRYFGWEYTPEKIKQGYYNDIHCKHPWNEHKEEILAILALLPTPLYE